jgi:NitT/TauT family transport system permease protein
MLIGELVGGSGQGLGYILKRSADSFEAPTMFAVLIILAVVSVTLVQATRWVEKRVAPWRDRQA